MLSIARWYSLTSSMGINCNRASHVILFFDFFPIKKMGKHFFRMLSLSNAFHFQLGGGHLEGKHSLPESV